MDDDDDEHRDSSSIPICNVCAIFLNLVVMESANIKKAADPEDLDLIFSLCFLQQLLRCGVLAH